MSPLNGKTESGTGKMKPEVAVDAEALAKGGLESPNYLDVFLVFFLLCQLQIWDHVSANANGDHCWFGARWFGFLESPNMFQGLATLGVSRFEGPKPPGPKPTMITIG